MKDELLIGDYVSLKFEEDFNKSKIVKVVELHEGYFLGNILDDFLEEPDIISYNAIEPLLLTEEILLLNQKTLNYKFSFEQKNDSWYVEINNNNNDEEESFSIQIKIKFVHELQHIFKLLKINTFKL